MSSPRLQFKYPLQSFSFIFTKTPEFITNTTSTLLSYSSVLSQSLRYPNKLSSAMALNTLLYSSKLCIPHKTTQKVPSSESSHLLLRFRSHPTNIGQTRPRESLCHRIVWKQKTLEFLLGLGVSLTLTLTGSASAVDLPLLGPLQLNEPSNALSLPTWAIHVSSVVEWITAMALVWQYGEKAGNESWKGLSWGMVPLLGGALCACTWHFFYNSESLEVLVALQAALTVVGNATMCIAAFRIYKSTEERSKNL